MNNCEDKKKEFIKELKDKALNVRTTRGKYRKRRPIVIEFSGAPKSGKTSSINSLMQFLKRNGFRVKILQESASVCPVKDKHSPMFNLWTACDSIKSLIGEMESNRTYYDVIIIDRGIFDALCWFQWLMNNDKMERSMKETIDNFLTMKELRAYIDIVFVYKVRPEISIEREYASLLTDILGSIMNKEVLKEYLRAIEEVEQRMLQGSFFRKIHSIDTSDKDQNVVGKEVTEAALDILEELFDERIGYIKLPELVVQKFNSEACMTYKDFEELGNIKDIQFEQRSILEDDYDRIQIVPIVVIREAGTGHVFVVRKEDKAVRGDSTEKGRILPYIGGHVREEDVCGNKLSAFLDICRTALKREIREELGISISLDNISPDIIYIKDGSKSDIHLAVCFVIEKKKETMKVRIDSGELMTDHSEKGCNIFVEPKGITNQCNPWGKKILEEYFDVISEDSNHI